MNNTSYFPLLIIFLVSACAQVGCTTGRLPAAPSDHAVQGQRWEGALTAQQAHVEPYRTVEVDVHFTGPTGAAFQVPAFWDAERGFRFRTAFPAAGVWRWRTTSNQPSDSGLDGCTGEVSVIGYRGKNPFYRHGDLRVSGNQRYLIHADGTPFLWMGDTAWNVAWKSTAEEWAEYVDMRVSQRFSVVHIVATGTVAPNSMKAPPGGNAPYLDDDTPNPHFWRALEAKLAYANDRGLIVMLTGVGKSPSGFGKQQQPSAFVRYLAGRFAGLMVVFSPSMDERFEVKNHEMGVRLQTLTTHMVTQHPGTNHSAVTQYHDAAYTDFCGVQSGHRNGNLELAYKGAREWTEELWQRSPVKPLILLEAMYDGLGHNNGPAWREQDVRKLGWIGWVSGARGYTYGAGDVPPKVPGASGGIWNLQNDPAAYDNWRKAIVWPSAIQMTHLRDFFAAIDWWRLEPAQDLLKAQAENQLRKMVVSRSPTGDLLVAYLPDNDEIVLDLSTLPAGLSGYWFNPVSGISVPLEVSVANTHATTLTRPSGWNDAALVLRKN